MEKQDPKGEKSISKGKGKDTNASESASLADRLQASGRMALNAVTTTPDLSGQITSQKATSGSSRNAATSASIAGEASSQTLRSTGPGDSLRTPSNTHASSTAFEDFVSSESTLAPELEQLHLEQRHHQLPTSTAVANQELFDGDAVLQLLDDPSGEMDMAVFNPDDAAQDEVLSPAEVASLRQALFGPGGNQFQSRWDSLLNFVPDFVEEPGLSLEAQLHLGTSEPAEARGIWLQQWSDVLSSYTDEVWGDLGPLAAEARQEVEQLTSGDSAPSQTPETKALDRLRQILAHVRGH